MIYLIYMNKECICKQSNNVSVHSVVQESESRGQNETITHFICLYRSPCKLRHCDRCMTSRILLMMLFFSIHFSTNSSRKSFACVKFCMRLTIDPLRTIWVSEIHRRFGIQPHHIWTLLTPYISVGASTQRTIKPKLSLCSALKKNPVIAL